MNSNQVNQMDLSNLANKILQQLKIDLGGIWSDRLSQKDRDLVGAVSSDAATVVVLGLAGPPGQAEREKAQIDAQLLNLTSAQASRVSQQFWSSVGTALKTALNFAVVFV